MRRKVSQTSRKPLHTAETKERAADPVATSMMIVAALARLNKASSRLWQTLDLEKGLKEMLTAMIEMLDADFGTVQLYNPENRTLCIATHHGFEPDFIRHFQVVCDKRNSTFCRALHAKCRVVIEDVEKDSSHAPYRGIARSAGYRAMQSTPLIARDGRPLGMISIYFRKPHSPSELELQGVDLYVRQAVDFIERCAIEQSLGLRGEQLRFALDAAKAGTWTLDAKTSEFSWDDNFHALYGFTNKHRRSLKTWISRVHKDERAQVLHAIECVRRDPSAGGWDMEFRSLHSDGRIVWHHALGRAVCNDKGEVQRLDGIDIDITERRRAVEDLRQREELLRSILNAVMDAVITVDGQGVIIGLNPAAERTFGYSEEEMLGRNVKMLMPPPYRDAHEANLQDYLRTGNVKGNTFPREARGLRKDGTIFPLEVAVTEIDHLGMFTGVIHDISGRRKLEREILEASESERAAIGQDLHDDLGQQLAGVWCMSQALSDQLEKRAAKEAPAAAQITSILAKVLATARGLARGLHPMALETGGLLAALKDLASRTSQMFGVPCRFHGPKRCPCPDRATAEHIFRIAQEAATNAAKHAKASQIQIEISCRNGTISLTVRDDGQGFAERLNSGGKGMGLHVMRYRANLIGADFKIVHPSDGGTVVTCIINRTLPTLP